MTAAPGVVQGDFSSLATHYSKYRPHYSETVLDAILGIVGATAELDAVDVGAGTGIWTRMLARRGFRSVTAIEPNPEMRAHGIEDSRSLRVVWRAGAGEATGLDDGCADLVTAASCFHWFDFEKGTLEIHRVLRPGGHFTALWNPRRLEENPELKEIENRLYEKAEIRRVSSGSSSFVVELIERLHTSPLFEDAVYLEGRHVQSFTQEQYLGVWRSVNDVRAQAGEERFAEFLKDLEAATRHFRAIEVTYRTRAWIMRRA